jgi:hypothetical protein
MALVEFIDLGKFLMRIRGELHSNLAEACLKSADAHFQMGLYAKKPRLVESSKGYGIVLSGEVFSFP